ncbi:borealin-like isoform X1 [Sitophilus oryzae]|uniref:Borealin-like isoform X1 n=1 Tax=Sitophilus oryzae TaxID=7048 RepID=A0A6J2XZZ3_SITOR|nr:borealin-like isoform X1 [Sitophilus oryzae]
MPRTKRIQNKKNIDAPYTNKKDLMLLIKDKEAEYLTLLDREREEQLQSISLDYMNVKASIKESVLNATVKDIISGELISFSETTVALSDLTNTLESTKSSANQTRSGKKGVTSEIRTQNRSASVDPKKSVKRSISLGCRDEGYRTAESTSSTTSGNTRMSRSKTRTVKQVSRSVSRNAGKLAEYKTPANKQPIPCNSGTITPKCKPNTPQVFLRRPKIGEVAWSNQGSPLLIGPVAPESTANVNIPLSNGNLVSLLPQKGIRMSQIPDVDAQTIHELKILRDNLIKVCSHVQK